MLRFSSVTIIRSVRYQSTNTAMQLRTHPTKWFYATTNPLRFPKEYGEMEVAKEQDKFLEFGNNDSVRLEQAFNKLIHHKKDDTKRTIEAAFKVEVNEDHLFEVDLESMEMKPVYWSGAVYEVRRGTWFLDGDSPLEPELAEELEKVYVEEQERATTSSDPETGGNPSTETPSESVRNDEGSIPPGEKGKWTGNPLLKKKDSTDVTKANESNDFLGLWKGLSSTPKILDISVPNKLGNRMILGNGVAYIMSESTVPPQVVSLLKDYDFGSGPGVSRVTRGYRDSTIKPETNQQPAKKNEGDKTSDGMSMSSLFELELSEIFGSSKKDDVTQKAMELEISEDYTKNDITAGSNSSTDGKSVNSGNFGDEQEIPDSKREVDHLILCIHGIGQILGSKFQAVNFIHTVNVLRKNMKKVYAESHPVVQETKQDSADASKSSNPLSPLKEVISTTKTRDQPDANSKVQVLPIVWRHSIPFQPTKHTSFGQNSHLPSLNDITISEIKPLRNILGSVVLDILLYYEPYYLSSILNEVVRQCNFVVNEFKKRNGFVDGDDRELKVSIMGHSLGSVIGFDLLSAQVDEINNTLEERKNGEMEALGGIDTFEDVESLQFDFPVDNYFAIGSPIAVFNLLKRKTISPRLSANDISEDEEQVYTSRPKCQNLYNIFHPCDPVAYKLEPLVSPSLTDLKPQGIVPDVKEEINKKIGEFTEKLGFDVNKLGIDSKWDGIQWENALAGLEKSLGRSDAVVKLLRLGMEEKKKQDEERKEHEAKVKRDLSDGELKKLVGLNYRGRVDYSMEQGLLDVSMISAVSAHVSYFEEEQIAKFIMEETIKEEKVPTTGLQVSLST